ncbi:MAG: urease accessory protein UreF [Cellvibrionaceae bacterium]
MAITITTEPALLRLMQLSSASLPVGGYSFSQGLEYAVELDWLTNKEQTADWLQLVMHESIARVDLPLLIRLIDAVQKKEASQFMYWNATVLACRETKELLLTETAMGAALVRLLRDMNIESGALYFGQPNTVQQSNQKISFAAAFAVAAVNWNIGQEAILIGYLWSWIENQVAAATKLVPLGQTAAQKLLLELSEQSTSVIEKASAIKDNEIGASLPGLAMASAWHETQYSRLFRS